MRNSTGFESVYDEAEILHAWNVLCFVTWFQNDMKYVKKTYNIWSFMLYFDFIWLFVCIRSLKTIGILCNIYSDKT